MSVASEDQFRATHRYARISARKARLVMDLIRNEPVDAALTKLELCSRRAAPMISKVVRSAVANATQKVGAESADLVVWRAFVDEGPTLKRWRPRAMGRVYPRTKRTSHLNVIVKTVGREAAAPSEPVIDLPGDDSPVGGESDESKR